MYFNFIGQTQIEFASRWKKTLSPDSVAQGKATGQMLAQNKSDVTKGIYTQAQTQKDLAYGVEKGKKLAATGKQAILTKAASPNRTMRPTTQRGNLRAAPAKGRISTKSAQSFQQGAQNQATNTVNANKARMQDSINKTLKQGKYAPPPTTPSATSSWTPPKSKVKVPTGSIGDDVRAAMGSKGGMADDIAKGVGRTILKKKLLVGAGIAAAGGLYAARKAKKERQQRPFKRLLGL